MKAAVGVSMVLALASPVAADSKIGELTTGYAKEAASCQVHADGVAKVDAGGKLLLADRPDDAVAADVAKLDAAHVTVQAYCDEINAVLELLRADPKATYKSLERQLDERDNKIRKLRQASKKTLDELDPVIRRMVPKINARVAPPDKPAKTTTAKFPSGRLVTLPNGAGAWKLSGTKTTDVAEYTEGKAVTTITVRAFTGATCEQQRTAIAGKDAANVTMNKVGVVEQGREQRTAWIMDYPHALRTIHAFCVAGDNRSWISTVDFPTPTPRALNDLADDPLSAVASQMLSKLMNP
jgi:hypothetical protein